MRSNEGTAMAVVVVIGALCALSIAGLGVVAGDVLDAARAQTAADGFALADVTAGEAASNGLAAAAGADVLDVDRSGLRTQVVVRVGDALATAAAERPVAGGDGGRAGLAPAMVAALARAEELLGAPVPIVSGFRSRARQQRLWDARHDNPYPVAPPGSSRHELGLAIDVPLNVVEALSRVALSAGLCHPLPESDPVHFVVCPARP